MTLKAFASRLISGHPQPNETANEIAANATYGPGKVHGHMLAITEGEIQRRVRDAFDKAVTNLDGQYLEAMDLMYRLNATIGGASVTFSSDIVTSAVAIRNWISQYFADCMGDPIYFVGCSGTPTASQVASSQKQLALAMGIPEMRIQRPVFAPSAKARDDEHVSIAYMLKFESRPLAQFLSAQREHLKLKAKEYFGSSDHPDQAIPPRKQVGAYLAMLLTQSVTPPEHAVRSKTHAEPAVAPSPIEGISNPPDKRNLHIPFPADVAEALFLRYQLLARRIVATDDRDRKDQQLQKMLKDVVRQGDPLDIAVTSLMLWEVGQTVRSSKAIMSVIEINESNQSGDGASQAQESQSASLGVVTVRDELDTKDCARRLMYDERTFRDTLVRKMQVGVHYYRPFGGRKLVFFWSKVAEFAGLPKEQW